MAEQPGSTTAVEPLVLREDIDRIAVLTLNSPANRNALSRAMVAELTAALNAASADESLHGVLLQSEHPVFCAGADLKARTVDMVESARGIIAPQWPSRPVRSPSDRQTARCGPVASAWSRAPTSCLLSRSPSP